MKYINFNKLSIKNFLSVGTEEVNITFDQGLHIITGVNKDKTDRRNGVGKSTIADALYFAVFGETLRELKKEHITNNVTGEKCQVTLNFTITDNNQPTEYKICRVLEPTKCFLYENDVDVTRDSIANTNSYISTLINSSPEVFQNCVIMTVNNTIPFMAKKKIEKRKFIEGILNLEVFGRMLNTLRSEHNDIMRTFDSECTRYEEASNNLQSYKLQKSHQDDRIKAQLDEYNNRFNNNTKKIAQLKAQISDSNLNIDIKTEENKILDHKNKLGLFEEKLRSLTSKISKVQTTIEYNTKIYKNIGTEDSSCPVCLKPISDHDKDQILIEKKQLKQEIAALTDKMSSYREKYKDSHEIKDKIQANILKRSGIINDIKLNKSNIENIQSRIDELEKRNDEIKNDIKSTSTQENQFDIMVFDTTQKLDKIQIEIDNIKKLIHTLDVVKFIVSEEGVKSYIVKKILQLLNGKLAYYLKKLDSNCICVFNEYFEDQIIDEKGKICSYFNFSGAERKNIDLACLFAFMDIRRLQGDVAFNFSIYDELFDSSLDEQGVELVIDILKERIEKHQESVMVISHRKESTKLATGEIIFLQKEKGITTRVDPSIIQE
jgi:DNA repair exonuclease SbcCD ATPase subunit